jgi:hypothetical protein
VAQFAYPSGDVSATNWTGTYLDIDEGATPSDSDFVYSQDNPALGDLFEVTLDTLTDPSSSTGHILRWRHVLIDGGSVASSAGTGCDLYVYLRQSTTTTIASKTLIALDSIFSWTQDSFTLTGGEADSITDYTALRYRAEADGGGGSPANRRGAGISWVQLEIPNAPTNPILDQVTVNWGSADGTESGHTLGTDNADINVETGADRSYFLRNKVNQTNASNTAGNTQKFKVQYRVDAGSWTDVPLTAGSNPVYMVDHASLTQGADTTNRLGGGSGTFLTNNNHVCDTADEGSTLTWPTSATGQMEALHSIRFQDAQITAGEVYDFRLVHGSGSSETEGTAFGTYSQPDATATIVAGPRTYSGDFHEKSYPNTDTHNITHTTATLVTGTTITPASGDYLAIANFVFEPNGGSGQAPNGDTALFSIYAGGSEIAESRISFEDESSYEIDLYRPLTTIGKVTVNGSQAVELRAWKVNGGTPQTQYIHERTLILIPLSGLTYGYFGISHEDNSAETAIDLSGGLFDLHNGFSWAASGGGTNEYYLKNSAGTGAPDISGEPPAIWDSVIGLLTKGTLGSLTDHQYGWGDNDTLGYSTVYFRDDTGDPDTSGVDLHVGYKASATTDCFIISTSGMDPPATVGSPAELPAVSVFDNGTEVSGFRRVAYHSASFPGCEYPMVTSGVENVASGQFVDFRYGSVQASGTGSHKRLRGAFFVLEVGADGSGETDGFSTTDATTSSTYADVDDDAAADWSLTGLTADEYIFVFSGSIDQDDLAQTATFAPFVDGSVNAEAWTARRHANEPSYDTVTTMPTSTVGRLTGSASGEASLGWKTSANTSTLLGRTFAVFKVSGGNDRKGQVSAFELETGDAPRKGQVSAFELETPNAPRKAQVSAFEFEVPTAPRKGQVSAFEFEVPNAPRKGQVSAFELETGDAPRKAQVSAFELETPNAARKAQVSAFEFEVPAVGRAQVSAFEFETGDAPRKAQVSAFEFETPNTNKAQVSAFELETGDAPRKAQVSAFELETPNAARKAQVSAFEFEVPAVGRAQVSAFEFEVPNAPRKAQVSAFEFEAPETTRKAQVSAFELEVPNAPRKAQVSAFEFETSNAPRKAQVSAFEFETPNAARKAQVSAFELEVPTAPRKAQVSAYEFEAGDAPRKAQVSAFEFEVPTANRRAQVSAFELEAGDAPRKAQVSAFEFEVPSVGAPGGEKLPYSKLDIGISFHQ